jgi:hypothetical protein
LFGNNVAQAAMVAKLNVARAKPDWKGRRNLRRHSLNG